MQYVGDNHEIEPARPGIYQAGYGLFLEADPFRPAAIQSPDRIIDINADDLSVKKPGCQPLDQGALPAADFEYSAGRDPLVNCISEIIQVDKERPVKLCYLSLMRTKGRP